MVKTVGLGHQDFETIRKENLFYVDKTDFIREWWDSKDSVTLITRPRRFGKTLTMSMLEQFFSVKYADRSDLFEGLSIWESEKYRKLQGQYPVISLSFANVKDVDFKNTRRKIGQLLENLYAQFDFLLSGNLLNDKERVFFQRISPDMEDSDAAMALHQLSMFLFRYYGKKVIILLDEYDTPMQEAYVNGYWEELTAYIRNMFNSAFKTNPYLLRGVMTGITRISKESVFSDLNNLEVVTTTSVKYETAFGFTEEEVFSAMDEYGLSEQKNLVKLWYDGFIFGNRRDIYNPWSITNYLKKKELAAYWANTSSNNLVSDLIRGGTKTLKKDFESLLRGEILETELDEQVVYDQLDVSEGAVWSLLLAGGYLRVKEMKVQESDEEWGLAGWKKIYILELTNFEVKIMFRNMIKEWFSASSSDYGDFIQALLLDDVNAMNEYMNRVALATFSFFDSGKKPSKKQEPERFYHGFVLGLMVDLADRYVILSNRESGFGRYDVILEPRKENLDAIIIEFKVFDARKEKSLEDTVKEAHQQIEDFHYETNLLTRGIPAEKVRKYGFAFKGKEVLIG